MTLEDKAEASRLHAEIDHRMRGVYTKVQLLQARLRPLETLRGISAKLEELLKLLEERGVVAGPPPTPKPSAPDL